MAACADGPIVCVSYLALAELWSVPLFPVANHGAEVRATEQSIAADGPMAAAVLAALDAPTTLVGNDIGDDEDGRIVRTWLRRRNVTTTAMSDPGVVTPWIVVIADQHHTRTWFAHLPGVVEQLAAVDLSPIATASFVYVDAYQLIETAAVRVIETARAAQVPVLVNLGGSPLSDGIRSAAAGYEKLLVQTNVDDRAHTEAFTVARSLLAGTAAAWVVVTAGAYGAVAVSPTDEVAVPAFPVAVRHTHCAGAAFSGGLLYGLREGWSMASSMVLGSASGALRCARHHSAPLPTLAELEAVVAGGGLQRQQSRHAS
ncbi:carbohydrate kinase family protein [Nocardia amamiensis]|uniref:Carbohydrate kinase family protein n=1 Tax=Nocardia amamiensis TaxID=404578 RepID=A0ABS0CQS5_9NOCA|nr:carbohydrate kinase family protein [Nocardia amamiensis]MBF6298981.1 carbohydrate kinase family protein [Nocardia amamiensis]